MIAFPVYASGVDEGFNGFSFVAETSDGDVVGVLSDIALFSDLAQFQFRSYSGPLQLYSDVTVGRYFSSGNSAGVYSPNTSLSFSSPFSAASWSRFWEGLETYGNSFDTYFSGHTWVNSSTWQGLLVFSELSGVSVDRISFSGQISPLFQLGGLQSTNSAGPLNFLGGFSAYPLVQLVGISSGQLTILHTFSLSSGTLQFLASDKFDIFSRYDEIGLLFSVSGLPTSASDAQNVYRNFTFGWYTNYVYSGCQFRLAFNDTGVSNLPISDSERTNILLEKIYNILHDSVVDLLQDIKSAISGLGSANDPTPSQSQVASDFKDSAQDQKDKIDQAQEEIDQNTNRPPPESLVPTTPPIIVDGQIGGGDEVALSAVTGVSDLLGSQLILSMLLLVFTLAFVSYVLFGKKG